jgi:LCP family protein required for cell wall assembly
MLGVGGGVHDGSDLTDTIIVASLDQDKKLVTMLSLPRDYWVEDKEMGGSRINEVYYNRKKYYKETSAEALEYTKTRIENITGVKIQYWTKIDFQGFTDIVDAIGGIDIDVAESIYDPTYPKGETDLYETFSVPKGLNHMDGETALKYARSRHSTSDFDRSRRQQDILYAIKDKMLAADILFSQSKIQKILSAIKDNLETNISVQEILTLGSYAKSISKDKIVQRLIHDDPAQCGGFLYTPERQFFDGAFVLIPAGGPESVYNYTTLNFEYPEIARENAKIHVLNSSKRAGAAGETKQILQRYCFDINRYGNGQSKDIQETTYYYKKTMDKDGNTIDKEPLAIEFLQKLIPGKVSTEVPDDYKEYMAGTDILLELGSDYTESSNYMEDPFYSLPMPAQTPDSPSVEGTTGTETGAPGTEEKTKDVEATSGATTDTSDTGTTTTGTTPTNPVESPSI